MKSLIKRIRNHFLSYKRNRMIKLDSREYKVKLFGNDYGGFNVCTDIISSEKAIVYSFGIVERNLHLLRGIDLLRGLAIL